jgi:hypothetical protein
MLDMETRERKYLPFASLEAGGIGLRKQGC